METLGDFYENLNDGCIGSGINAVSKVVDRNEDLIDKIGDAGGIIAGVGKHTFNLINEILEYDNDKNDYSTERAISSRKQLIVCNKYKFKYTFLYFSFQITLINDLKIIFNIHFLKNTDYILCFLHISSLGIGKPF
jgi:hypothetical protein